MQNTFKVGDRVKLARKLSYGRHNLPGFDNSWFAVMDKFVGEEYTISSINKQNGIHFKGINLAFPPSCLDPVKAKGSIDWTKPVQTSEGDAVTIILTDARGDYPVLGYIGDTSHLIRWTQEGHYLSGDREHPYDLINVPEPKKTKEIWVTMMQRADGSIFTCTNDSYRAAVEESARRMVNSVCILLAQQKFTVTSGTFDKE